MTGAQLLALDLIIAKAMRLSERIEAASGGAR